MFLSFIEMCPILKDPAQQIGFIPNPIFITKCNDFFACRLALMNLNFSPTRKTLHELTDENFKPPMILPKVYFSSFHEGITAQISFYFDPLYRFSSSINLLPYRWHVCLPKLNPKPFLNSEDFKLKHTFKGFIFILEFFRKF